MFLRKQVIRNKGFFCTSCSSRPLDFKSHWGNIESVDVERCTFLELAKISRKQNLYMNKHFLKRLYQPTEEQQGKLRAMNVPPHNWHLAILEDFDQIDYEELQLMATWRADLAGGKIKADKEVCKAIIGATFAGHNCPKALFLMAWLGCNVLPSRIIDKNPQATQFCKWKKPRSDLDMADESKKRAISNMLIGYSALESKLGYTFRDKSLLLQAVLHSSMAKDSQLPVRHNGLLACFGDAVVDILVAKHCYEDPQKLNGLECTKRHIALVSTMTLATAVVRADIQKFLRHKNIKKMAEIYGYQRRLESRGFQNEGYGFMFVKQGDCTHCYEAPGDIANFLEALLGAIYLDSDFSLDIVSKILLNLIDADIKFYSHPNYMSMDDQLCQIKQTMHYRCGEPLNDGKLFKVILTIENLGEFIGVGHTARLAREGAKKSALDQIKLSNK